MKGLLAPLPVLFEMQLYLWDLPQGEVTPPSPVTSC